MRKLAISLAAASTMTAASVQAEQYYGFANVSVNYLDWSEKAEDRSNPEIGAFGGEKEDFFYLELEGGAGFDWGDVYGFVDLENAESTRNEGQFSDDAGDTGGFRIAAKGNIAVNMGSSNWNYYGHIYSFTEASNGFYDQNVVLGVSYDLFTDSGFWIKPFLGVHIENQTFSGSGTNGYMAGYVLGYDFTVSEQKFSIVQWHETEFARKDQFRGNGTAHKLSETGQNGAVSVWWHASKAMSAGIQYRYADHKLGTAAYHDAVIFTAKYNF